MEFQNILVRATNWVGDAVMSVPALQALRERFPKAHITILARPWVGALYEREPFCDEVLAYDAPRGWAGFGEKLRIARELRKRRFDCAIVLQNAFEAAALMWAAGIPVRVGYERDGRGLMLTRAIPVPKAGEIPKHQRFFYLELLKRAEIIGGYGQESSIRLAGAPQAAEAGRRRLRTLGVMGPIVGISPGAAYGGAKRWLPERFAEAAVSVARERGAAVAVFGSREEQQIAREVEHAIEEAGERCFNFAGRTTLEEFIEIVAACDLYITNDSGPMHIASALRVPTLAVFGATDDQATGPTGAHSVVVREPVECSPCLLRECPIDHRCMTRVSAARVAQIALTMTPDQTKVERL
jgi:heptosyltransferase-2